MHLRYLRFSDYRASVLQGTMHAHTLIFTYRGTDMLLGMLKEKQITTCEICSSVFKMMHVLVYQKAVSKMSLIG